MSKTPQYIKDGWRPHGPSRCRCPRCGTVVSTNAFARAKHDCPPERNAAFDTPLTEAEIDATIEALNMRLAGEIEDECAPIETYQAALTKIQRMRR